MIDDKNYTVVGVNGFRKPCLTFDQAVSLAARMKEQMRLDGWAGKVSVYYRDGSLVDWEQEIESRKTADRIDGYDRDDLGESPDW